MSTGAAGSFAAVLDGASYDVRAILARALDEHEVSVDDAEAKSWFESHPTVAALPEHVHVKQILVPTEEEAKQIKARLDRGESFESLAVSGSEERLRLVFGQNVSLELFDANRLRVLGDISWDESLALGVRERIDEDGANVLHSLR